MILLQLLLLHAATFTLWISLQVAFQPSPSHGSHRKCSHLFVAQKGPHLFFKSGCPSTKRGRMACLYLVGGPVYPPLWKIWLRPLGWLEVPNISGKMPNWWQPNHQPVFVYHTDSNGGRFSIPGLTWYTVTCHFGRSKWISGNLRLKPPNTALECAGYYQ